MTTEKEISQVKSKIRFFSGLGLFVFIVALVAIVGFAFWIVGLFFGGFHLIQ